MNSKCKWCLVALVGALVGFAVAQEQKLPSGAAMPDMATMMKQWKDAATPGEPHKKLQPFVGEWTIVTRMWMAGPSAPPTETKGKASFKWVLDGRFLLQEIDGEMLMPDENMQIKPIKFNGMGLTGHDNYRNLYIGNWADNTSTWILNMAGTIDPSGKIITMYGEMDEPMLSVRGRMVKYVTTFQNDDTFKFEVFDLAAGPDHKAFEIVYTRSK